MDRKFENHVKYIKYRVLKEIATSLLNGTLEDDVFSIPKRIITGSKAETRCCIYKERAIISERVRHALAGDKNGGNIVEVIDIACDECPIYRFSITEACRGCLAHRCMESCPVGAISFVNHKAHIDQDKCIECGRCTKVCPYNAIADVRRPCIRSCKTRALHHDPKTKIARIDYEKCIQCGACVYQCPFGAIVDQSSLKDVINLIRDSGQNKNYNVYALVAPSISNQFADERIGQIIAGIRKLGFSDVLEVAYGADMVVRHEVAEITGSISEKKWMTSSCCPTFVSYIDKKYPSLADHVSKTVSPMIALARFVKHSDPAAKVVFIGPCISKKAEIKKENVLGDVDYVITFEELQAFLDAREIIFKECEEAELNSASYFGRIFARSGGVAEAVKHILETDYDGAICLETMVCSGIGECDKAVKAVQGGKMEDVFIEAMACEGGCICGPASLSHGKRDRMQVEMHAEAAPKTCTDMTGLNIALN